MTIPLSSVSWILLMVLISIYSSLLFGHHVVVCGAQCLSHQQSLLLQLKDNLIFNTTTSKILVQWNQSSDCCSWPGISCDHEGSVIGLKLSNESISGGIDNSTLFNLAYLKSLDLSLNNFDSTIPSRIGNLTNLSYLNFSDAGFWGQIPKEISSLSRLVTLDLSSGLSVFGSGKFVEYICPSQLQIPNLRMLVENITKLEELYLDGITVLAPGGNEWGMALSSSLPNLRVLSLRCCYLSGPIHQSLAKLKSLSVIQLDANHDLSSRVPEFFANFSNLTSLSLSHCSLYGTFPKEIFQVPTLRTLDISYNSLLQGSLSEFPADSHLQSLVLSYTYFGGRLPASIGNLVQLSRLDLHDCHFDSTLPDSITNLTQLVDLDLSDNSFTGPIPSFHMSKNLTTIYLFNNRFIGPIPSAHWEGLWNLVYVNLWNNSLSGNIPSSLFALPSLATIDLSHNRFNGPIPSAHREGLWNLVYVNLWNNSLSGNIPSSLFALPSLEIIDLSHNSLSGNIPSSLFALPSLEIIDLSHNSLSGNIPSSLFALPSLVIIDLSHNSLSGNIPSSLFALPSLEIIDLSYNQFSGQLLEFPNATSSMLSYIYLSSNKLQGTIPMSIFKLRELVSLFLSFNKFNSTIELDLTGDLPNLYVLDLSNNDLILLVSESGNNFNFSYFPRLRYLQLASCKLGVFPDLIKNLPELFYLDLSNNQIYGEIPSWVWEVGSSNTSSLLGVNVSHNQLVGMQEPYSLHKVGTLDLSFNQFQGKIPILPPNAYIIDLSSNNFTFSIPSDIGDIYYLSLSNNGLTGVIPESICSASRIQVLDLSNNSLNGRIPRCILALNQTTGVNLGSNNLSGPIPDAFPVNCSLKILDVNGNSLTDRIPKSLGNCNALELLNLGNNQMVDTFPLLLKNISTLRVLVLRSNKLHGHITCPDNIGDWPMIQIVNVASNNFSGQLPSQCLTKWHAVMVAEGDAQSELKPNPNASIALLAYYYRDAVKVTNKGLEMELVKIPKGFSYIDFSSNNFHGEIPKELGLFKSLIVLNLSNNALSGHIPSSFGDLKQLESLDLAKNHLNGEIPASLSNLNFLQVLDLSHNQLSGRIPTGNQIQTFPADSFRDNEGLCGPPLTPNCRNDVADTVPKTPDHGAKSSTGIKWDLISVEVGFVVGFGTVIAPLVFSRRWRKCYFDHVEDIAFWILPQLLLKKWVSWKYGNTKTKGRGIRIRG